MARRGVEHERTLGVRTSSFQLCTRIWFTSNRAVLIVWEKEGNRVADLFDAYVPCTTLAFHNHWNSRSGYCTSGGKLLLPCTAQDRPTPGSHCLVPTKLRWTAPLDDFEDEKSRGHCDQSGPFKADVKRDVATDELEFLGHDGRYLD